MIVDRIQICDFRSFSGVHDISLSPRVKYGAERPIILFGGLNGAGKTSILLAIKLALYGRHGLGLGTTKAEYERFIASAIHKPVGALVEPNSASVAIAFTYGKLGTKTEYEVRRHWYLDGQRLEESLQLFENGTRLSSLSIDECQGFLNELVPLGVSELFFFDGEKIAELAEDDSGGALGDAIRRLLGLDLIERLRTDLRVYSLKYGKKQAKDSVAEEIETLEMSLQEQKAAIAAHQEKLDGVSAEAKDVELSRERVEQRLAEIGGDWGQSREGRKQRARELSESVSSLESQIRHELSGAYPLSLAMPALKDAMESTAQAAENDQQEEINLALLQFSETVRASSSPQQAEELESALEAALSQHARPIRSVPKFIDASTRELATLEHLLDEQVPAAAQCVASLASRRNVLSEELDQISVQIDRAPDAESLRAEMDEFTELTDHLSSLQSEMQFLAKELKEMYQRALETARQLKKKHEQSSEQRELEGPLRLAARSRVLLKEFGEINAARKVKQLETEFTKAFARLARKEDIVLNATIDPTSFKVSLIDNSRREIDKAQLSAGERQIYAVAMLEALANTSGRRLPIIIDTPLGRLDSQHRTKLIEHYFPRASHQVILLSTDTEVDEHFYRSLSPSISHAFEISFDEHEKASTVQEGYFWRHSYRKAG